MSAPSTPHKSRKKKRQLVRSNTLSDIGIVKPGTNIIKPEFNLVAFLLPARGTVSQWIVIPLILIFAGLFRWSVGLWEYSGFNTPPTFGDFEAQRHWMEITQHLPVSMWYFYDPTYWRLDYPPLTAYHSWICGKIGTSINPDWFTLYSSRGSESPSLKVFMRATVLVSEYLIYVPALIIFLRHYSRNQGTGSTARNIALVAILMQPANMLIDNGHFQFNTVMLGFIVATLSSIYAGRPLWACIFFVAALGFKQMSLYYAPAIFAYLLGSCFTPELRLGRLISIAIVTLLAFAALFTPLIAGTLYDLYRGFDLPYRPPPPFLAERGISLDPNTIIGAILLQISQSVHRIFPFSRGVFEDKVANFWCSVHQVYKLHRLEGMISLARLSTFATLVAILPTMSVILAVPRPSLLPFAFASTAYAFYLFSFQVHEKSILIPLLPVTLLLGSRKGLSKEYRAWIGFANALAVWTMYPLLRRDGVRTPYVVLSFLWIWLLGLPPLSVSCYYDPELPNVPGRPLAPDELRTLTKITHWWFYIIIAFWHLLFAFAEPPAHLPDLGIVVNAGVGCVGHFICWGWCQWKLWCESGILDDYFAHLNKMLEGQSGQLEDANDEQDTIAVTPPMEVKKEGKKAERGRGKGGKKR